MSKKPKVVICISGGCLQSVYADTALNIELFDEDNKKAEGKSNDEIEKEYEESTKNLKALW